MEFRVSLHYHKFELCDVENVRERKYHAAFWEMTRLLNTPQDKDYGNVRLPIKY